MRNKKANLLRGIVPVLILVALMAALLGGCGGTGPSSADDGKINIVASFYPLAEFARQAGGDAVSVTAIVPAGTEPHDFEPTPQDLSKISGADLFIYNGGGFDAWAGKIALQRPSGAGVVNMADLLGLSGGDPHFWLDPVLAAKETEIIRDALINIDPARAQLYADNTAAYGMKLAALDAKFTAGLSSCAQREIFTSHTAFTYLARKYGLVQKSIAGLSPDAEPSARQLVGLADAVKATNARYIFFETLASPKLAETLAAAADAQTMVLNPLEGLTADELKSGRNYVSVMEDNLANLKLALNCR